MNVKQKKIFNHLKNIIQKVKNYVHLEAED